MLVAGEIKLKVSGREVTVNGQQAIDALKTNNAFKTVGVVAARRATVRSKCWPGRRAPDRAGRRHGGPARRRHQQGRRQALPALPARLRPAGRKAAAALGCPAATASRTLNQEIADVLLTDASDAPQRLGGGNSPLYDSLKWALEVKRSARQRAGAHRRANCSTIAATIEDLPRHRRPGELRAELAEDLEAAVGAPGQARLPQAHRRLQHALTASEGRVRDAVISHAEPAEAAAQGRQEDLQRLPEWAELTQEEQQQRRRASSTDWPWPPTHDLPGCKKLLATRLRHPTALSSELKRSIQQLGPANACGSAWKTEAQGGKEGPSKLSRSDRRAGHDHHAG